MDDDATVNLIFFANGKGRLWGLEAGYQFGWSAQTDVVVLELEDETIKLRISPDRKRLFRQGKGFYEGEAEVYVLEESGTPPGFPASWE
jgi:hypothetical protein